MKKLTIAALFFGSLAVAAAAPHSHKDDSLTPVIEFLKKLRKARKHASKKGSSSGIFGNREESEFLISPAASSPFAQFQQQQQLQQQASPSQSQPTSVPILFPSGSDSFQSAPQQPSIPSAGNNNAQISIQFPNITPRPPSSPEDITRINSGVSTILAGVRNFDLGQILRGAFVFPTNNNVKSVANTVIDSIFGASRSSQPGSASTVVRN